MFLYFCCRCSSSSSQILAILFLFHTLLENLIDGTNALMYPNFRSFPPIWLNCSSHRALQKFSLSHTEKFAKLVLKYSTCNSDLQVTVTNSSMMHSVYILQLRTNLLLSTERIFQNIFSSSTFPIQHLSCNNNRDVVEELRHFPYCPTNRGFATAKTNKI